ncbi:ABC-2 type transport system permease protein [Gordonia malaquae]|uniref:Putative ABC transporter permease protein n=1 Tax=Gordonia malaquae NBRC 108250 TaxID=1223542 RepID=M3UN48_GORML|nr:ABC transporter permease [Gordonia malaquae]GAC81460.1 putative ABC transporter permease protein [Gordonia malaquae NBRC 108250]SEB90601.1 ABC-2 type transport system permease protein [Gordonia malaquae]
MSGLPLLLRAGIRRDRVIAPVAVALFLLINVSTAVSIRSMYSSPEQIAVLRAGAGTNTAFVFLLGPLPADTSQAALTSWRAGLFMIAALGVFAAMTVVRQTRREEEAGRTELVLAGGVGRLVPLIAGCFVAAATVLATSVGMAAVIGASGGDAASTAIVFAQYVCTGFAAIGVAAICAEVAAGARSANIAASSIVAGGYLLRGIGDAAPDLAWLRWTNPIGWAERMAPFDGNSLLPVAASLAVAAGGVAAACGVRSRRDLGAGLFVRRPGPANGPARWSTTEIVWRLVRTHTMSWAVGTGVYAFVVGYLSSQVADFAAGNSYVEKIIAATGAAGITDGFVVAMTGFLAVAAAGGGVAIVVSMRGEERAGRAEAMLAAPVARLRLYGTYAGWTAVTTIAVLGSAAAGVAAGSWASGGDAAHVAGLAFTTAAASVPAVLLVVAVVAALYGMRSTLAVVGWPIVLGSFALGPLGDMFGVPSWLRQLSPFTHVPAVPVTASAWLPLLLLTFFALVIATAGALAYRRRDIG